MSTLIFLSLICTVLASPSVIDTNKTDPVSILEEISNTKFVGEYVHIDNKNDQFDWELTKEIFRTNINKNTIISPLSVKILMTLIAEAAGKSVYSLTRKQLEVVLPKDKKLDTARDGFKKILDSMKRDSMSPSSDYKVNFATRIFVDKNVKVEQKFAAMAEYHYHAKVDSLNFTDAKDSAKQINEFAKEKTEGKITELVSEDVVSRAIFLLVNALYFEGKWLYPFKNTVKKEFTSARKTSKITFMEHTRNYYFLSSKELKSSILRIPYAGEKYSMFIILPWRNSNLNETINKFNNSKYNEELKNIEEMQVHAVIPRFKFDTSVKLNDAMKALGITEIFENTATLPGLARGGLTERKLKVSNIIQKSGIVVDEKGTTAWSATEIEIVNRFGGGPIEFIADRPFLFYVEDETTGAKLFTGRVDDPKF